MENDSDAPIFPPNGRRLLVYAVRAERGFIEDSVRYALDGLRRHAAYVLVVVDGRLTEGSRQGLSEIPAEIIARVGVGSSVWAFQAALEVERKRHVLGESVAVRVDRGGRRGINNNINKTQQSKNQKQTHTQQHKN